MSIFSRFCKEDGDSTEWYYTFGSLDKIIKIITRDAIENCLHVDEEREF